jgi:glycosyltransferase involved in cell wall biosynthesis
VAHPPTGLRGLHRGRGRYLFTVSRLDAPKRIDLLIRAMQHVHGSTELRIAGTGPQEPTLRSLAADDPRIRFTGFLNDVQLTDAYAGARVVLFAPAEEDYGYITLEAMLSRKPVITTVDAGGPTELVKAGVSGLITEPDPAAIGEAVNLLVRRPWMARRMGRAGEQQGRAITWDAAVATLLDGLET